MGSGVAGRGRWKQVRASPSGTTTRDLGKQLLFAWQLLTVGHCGPGPQLPAEGLARRRASVARSWPAATRLCLLVCACRLTSGRVRSPARVGQTTRGKISKSGGEAGPGLCVCRPEVRQDMPKFGVEYVALGCFLSRWGRAKAIIGSVQPGAVPEEMEPLEVCKSCGKVGSQSWEGERSSRRESWRRESEGPLCSWCVCVCEGLLAGRCGEGGGVLG